MRHTLFSVILLFSLLCAVVGCNPSPAGQPATVNLSPTHWAKGETEKYLELNQFQLVEPELIHMDTGQNGMVVGVSSAPAVHAGLEALRQGGSAADAALTTALAQVALNPGSFVTYAGIMTMVYYDAVTDQVYSMNAAWDIPSQENNFETIPVMGSGVASGRTAMVPGFMAGVEAAHQRFGKLPFEQLFEPSIYFAEQGYNLDDFGASLMHDFRKTLSRLPETKQIFTKEDGEFFQAGDLFQQPELAATLRQVAAQGAAYMYTGPWAEKFVDALQRDGGKITLQDLTNYQVIWSEPVHTTYGEYDIYSQGLPSHGGVNLIEAFNLMEAADLKDLGRYTEDPEALFWLMQIQRVWRLSYLPAQDLAQMGRDLSLQSRQTKETAQWLWEQMQAGEFILANTPTEKQDLHSSAVVAVDQWGSMAAIIHTCNAYFWGDTGIFVDGVAIPDPAAHQQAMMAQAGPGKRLPDPTNPLIVMQAGKPVVASAGVGVVHIEALQRLLNLLDYGMDPQGALQAPRLLSTTWGQDLRQTTERVEAGQFDPALLQAVRDLGQPVEEFQGSILEKATERGWWIGVSIDPATGQMQGASPLTFGGYAEGY